jgi:hypothetical protein
MVVRKMTRRSALKAMLCSAGFAIVPGCERAAKIASAGRVVVRWGVRLGCVSSAVLTLATLVLELIALIDGVRRTMTTRLTQQQASALRQGGQLILRDVDGREQVVNVVVS